MFKDYYLPYFHFFFERYSFRENENQIDFNEIIIKLSMGVKMANN